MRQLFVGLILGVMATAVDAGDLCWNSAADHTGEQGMNDWFYGYVEEGGEFQLMKEFNPVFGSFGPTWTVDFFKPEPFYWTQIQTDLMHGNGTTTTGGRTPIDHEAVLRWSSPIDATVIITGHAVKDFACGNGVDWFIRKNGKQIFAEFIPGNDATVGIAFFLEETVATGDTIDFVVNSHKSNDLCDGTVFNATIFVDEGIGDLNLDGCIGQTDLGILLAAFGTDDGGDIDGDMITGQQDLGILLANFGDGCRCPK